MLIDWIILLKAKKLFFIYFNFPSLKNRILSTIGYSEMKFTQKAG